MKEIYYLFAIVYTFMVWGIGWGIVSIFVPIFPIIDLVRYFIR
jgi:hypothetical protein